MSSRGLTDQLLANRWIRQKFLQTDCWSRGLRTDSELSREAEGLVRFLEDVEGASSIYDILRVEESSNLLFDVFALFGCRLIGT